MILTETALRFTDLEGQVEMHATDINSLDETIATLRRSTSDLKDTVDSVEDDGAALNAENDEIKQRLTLLEETVMGMLIYALFYFLFIPYKF